MFGADAAVVIPLPKSTVRLIKLTLITLWDSSSPEFAPRPSLTL
jgi:hypothetical protein